MTAPNATQSANDTTNVNPLHVGARIHCSLYGGKNGTIYSVEGTPSQSAKELLGGVVAVVRASETYINVVWDNGTVSKRIPECIAKGVQWRILEEPSRSQAEIDEALAFVELEQKRRDAEEKAAKQAFNDSVASLRNDDRYDHLEQSSQDNPIDSPKLAAKNIRKALKKDYPGIKFSVRKRSYDSVMITWAREDNDRVEAIGDVRDHLTSFKSGYYDQLSDCFLSSDSPFNVVFGGVEYIFCQSE